MVPYWPLELFIIVVILVLVIGAILWSLQRMTLQQ